MKIEYLYSGCSSPKYTSLFEGRDIMILQQNQKYHSLLVRGLKENGMDVEVVSGLPINRRLTKAFRIPAEKETVEGVNYRYFSTINFPAIRRIQLLVKSFFHTLSKDKDTILICDVLDVSSAIGSLMAARLKGIKAIGIVTDVPGHLSTDTKRKSLLEKINISILNKFDAYVLLTEAMNAIVNTRNKPYIVLEGHVDSRMKHIDNLLENKSFPKVLMYAGSLKKVYGIDRLTQAFVDANIPGWELHIYGDGNFRNELEKICKKYPSVKYLGIKLNDEIVNAEQNASLLVNPRPTDADYTKYSFPSKNMEYMASGTPVLTTNLPGMPKEYIPYIYLIEDESVSGMTDTLKKILTLPPKELHEKGTSAKNYVISCKSETNQTAHIIKLIHSIV